MSQLTVEILEEMVDDLKKRMQPSKTPNLVFHIGDVLAASRELRRGGLRLVRNRRGWWSVWTRGLLAVRLGDFYIDTWDEWPENMRGQCFVIPDSLPTRSFSNERAHGNDNAD